MTMLKIPSSIIQQELEQPELTCTLIKHPLHFGRFPLLGLHVTDPNIKLAIDSFCAAGGYTTGWSHYAEKDGRSNYYVMTKLPVKLVMTLFCAQTDQIASEMVGAWPIAMCSTVTALNVIVGRRMKSDGMYVIDKFSLYYPESYPVTRMEPVPILEGLSFRTGILKLELDHARDFFEIRLPQLKNVSACTDLTEDAIYFNSPQPHLRLEMAKQFVKCMKTEYVSLVTPSYENPETHSLMEDELQLIRQEVDDTITFAISIIPDNNLSCEAYPEVYLPLILKAYETAYAQNPLPVANGWFSIESDDDQSQEILLPDFHGARIQFHKATVASNQSAPTHLGGIQRTSSGGFRYVFFITVNQGDTTYHSPLDHTIQPVPAYIKNQQEERVQWCWSDSPIKWNNQHRGHNHFQLLPQYSKVENWTMYPNSQSDNIEKSYLEGDEDCIVNIGATQLTIRFGYRDLGERTMAVQFHGQRQHFVKRLMVTDYEYQQEVQTYKTELASLLPDAIGDTETCAICLETLDTNKCTLLSCKHIFHSLCIHTCMINGHMNQCPCCKTNVSHISTASDAMETNYINY